MTFKNDKLNSEQKRKDDAIISIPSEVVKVFYQKILESPELYPYFMTLRPNGLWTKCERMAKYFSCIYNKDIITPADTLQLKKTHHGLNISEAAYDEFTKLFAHICCRGKDDNCRRRMLRINNLLKAHICPSAGKQKNLGIFCKVISQVNPIREYTKDDEERTRVTSRFDKVSRFSVENTKVGHLFFDREEVWNEKAQAFHLRKRMRNLEKILHNIHKKCDAMEKRVTELEGSSLQSGDMRVEIK